MIAEFAAFAREAGAVSINVVATAAIRSARNRDELLARIAAILHFSDGDKDGARPFLSLLPAAEKRLLRRCGALLA